MFLFLRPLPFANIYPLMSGNTPQRDVHYIAIQQQIIKEGDSTPNTEIINVTIKL